MNANSMAPYWLGIDLGTSGARAVAVDGRGEPVAEARVGLPPPLGLGPGQSEQAPNLWWEATCAVIRAVACDLHPRPCAAVAVDGTSATLMLCRADGEPLGPALMYNDARATAAATWIAERAPPESAARGPSASLAKLIHLAAETPQQTGRLALHQADWISGRLCGHYGTGDWNNALKLGFDAERLQWPDWVKALIPPGVALPHVLAPGTPIGTLTPTLAADLGLSPATRVLAGTTDSTAAVIAAGARKPGEAVTCLGSTLVLKVITNRPIAAARYGVYSHRFGNAWIAGGASNSGGAVLLQHFTLEEIRTLSAGIKPEHPSGLDYYPLPGIGERFPRADPTLVPRLQPRPADPRAFLHGLLEGLAAIEAEGYQRLQSLGAPAPTRVLTTGGGAANSVWTRLRERALEVPVVAAPHQEAAYGTARLVLASDAGTPDADFFLTA
jgi:D-ribulokinase